MPTPAHGADFLAFLKRITRVYRGRELHVVVDNSSTHSTPAVQAWLAAHPADPAAVRRALQPHHNPVERVWGALKAHLANSPTLTMAGHLRQVHAFFRHRTSVQMLQTAAPLSSAGVDHHQQQQHQPDLGPGSLHAFIIIVDGASSQATARPHRPARRSGPGQYRAIGPIGRHRAPGAGDGPYRFAVTAMITRMTTRITIPSVRARSSSALPKEGSRAPRSAASGLLLDVTSVNALDATTADVGRRLGRPGRPPTQRGCRCATRCTRGWRPRGLRPCAAQPDGCRNRAPADGRGHAAPRRHAFHLGHVAGEPGIPAHRHGQLRIQAGDLVQDHRPEHPCRTYTIAARPAGHVRWRTLRRRPGRHYWLAGSAAAVREYRTKITRQAEDGIIMELLRQQ